MVQVGTSFMLVPFAFSLFEQIYIFTSLCASIFNGLFLSKCPVSDPLWLLTKMFIEWVGGYIYLVGCGHFPPLLDKEHRVDSFPQDYPEDGITAYTDI